MRQWIESRWRDARAALVTTSLGAIPLSVETIASTRPELADLLMKQEQYLKASGLLNRWPFPLHAGHLFLVLRQWVHDEPSETLATQMETDPTWAATTCLLRERQQRATHYPGQQRPWNDRLLDDIVSLLAQCQLPVTPANIGFTLAAIVDDESRSTLPTNWERLVLHRDQDKRPLPARGVQLTTLVFASLALTEPDEHDSGESSTSDQPIVWQVQPNAQVQMTGDLAHVTGPFIQGPLSTALIGHRNFANHLAQHPFTLTSAVRRAQPGSFATQGTQPDPELDYLKEALKTARGELHSLSQVLDWQIDVRIGMLLKRTQNKVAQRRRRAGVSTTPPKGWRHEAERLIREELAC